MTGLVPLEIGDAIGLLHVRFRKAALAPPGVVIRRQGDVAIPRCYGVFPGEQVPGGDREELLNVCTLRRKSRSLREETHRLLRLLQRAVDEGESVENVCVLRLLAQGTLKN